jgi:hypothetical protein
MPFTLMRATCVLLSALSVSGALFGAGTRIESVPGQSLFSFEYPNATDFSGITWVAGPDYFTVSDKMKGVFPLRIELEQSSGRVLSAKLGTMIPVKTRLSDFEGVAFVPDRRAIYVSAEKGNGILGIGLETGAGLPVTVPPVFARARGNKSLESLTYDPASRTFWTANEEALEGDSPLSSTDAGTIVRLQKFDRAFKPLGQYAWRTSSAKFRIHGSGTGVTDLAALPDGGLLVLERVANHTGLSAKIFRAGIEGATDVSRIRNLEGGKFVPAERKLLFERATLVNNFEGITLGPKLDDGWRSLLLIADSAGGSTHYLMPLRIRWDGGR